MPDSKLHLDVHRAIVGLATRIVRAFRHCAKYSDNPRKGGLAKISFPLKTLEIEIKDETNSSELEGVTARVRELETRLQTTTEERDKARKDLDQERSERAGDAEDCASEKSQLRNAQEPTKTELQQAQTRVTNLEEELRAAKKKRDVASTSGDAEKKKDVERIIHLKRCLEDARKELEAEREGRASNNHDCESKKAKFEAKIKANSGNAQDFSKVTSLEGQVKLVKEHLRDTQAVGVHNQSQLEAVTEEDDNANNYLTEVSRVPFAWYTTLSTTVVSLCAFSLYIELCRA